MEEKNIANSSLGKKVLEKIQMQKVKPSPRWVFLLKNYSAWVIGVLSLVIGSLASSVVFYMLMNNDWDVYKNVDDNLFSFILLTLPYFWMILLVLLIIVTDYNLKNTKKGYRYSTVIVFITTFSVSIFIGAILYNFEVGRIIDNAFADKVPVYEAMFHKMNHRKKIWMNPDRGLLIGIVSDSENGNNFVIKDFQNNTWMIITEQAEFIGKTEMITGDGVRIIGKREGDNLFRAMKIFYLAEKRWLTPPPDFMRPHDFFLGPHGHMPPPPIQ